jgi:hypothetical protein
MKTANTISINNIKSIQYTLFDFGVKVPMPSYLFDKNIKCTTNKIENKLSTTRQKFSKKQFKTVSRVPSCLKPIISHQNKKLGEKFIDKIIKKIIIPSVKSIISSLQEAII